MPRSPGFLATALAAAALAVGCGREAPFFETPPPETHGSLCILSTPAGATILLDGQDTGAVTPDTLESVAVGLHVVRVRLTGYAADPESLLVDVTAPDLASASFTLEAIPEAPPKVVLLEGFSNVDCIGCPELAEALAAVMAEPGHGIDRVLLIKWAASWPNMLDPHYQANPQDNIARLTTYMSDIAALPTLFADGARVGASGTPPTVTALSALVDQLLGADPGFAIAVRASVTAEGVAAEATLTAVRAVERPGARLHLVLVENPVIYSSPPGSEGETEFHWIMRDMVTPTDSPLPLTADAPAVRSGMLTPQPACVRGHLAVIAFVQDPATREVLQAGYAPLDPIHSVPAKSTRTFPTTPSP